jgi:hypothetical protein
LNEEAELLGERLVETILLYQARPDVVRQVCPNEVIGRVTWQDAEEEEDDYRGTEECQDCPDRSFQ